MPNYIVLDLEGTDENRNRSEAQIIEIAMIKFVEGQYHSFFESLVNPGCHIGNSQIHGITDHMVKTAPSLAEIIADVADFIGDFVLVVHNPAYDTRLLQRAYESHLGETRRFLAIDTVDCVKQAFPAFKKQNLELLSSLFGFSVGAAHRAMNDVIATNRILALCAETCVDAAELLSQAQHSYPLPPKEPKNPPANPDDTTLPLYGKRLVLTGVFRSSSKRLVALAERAGARVDRDVKLTTDYLVIGRQNATQLESGGMSSRERTARRHNEMGRAQIEFLREDEFFALLRRR